MNTNLLVSLITLSEKQHFTACEHKVGKTKVRVHLPDKNEILSWAWWLAHIVPSYSGGRDRRIGAQDQPQADSETLSKKKKAGPSGA
jgi:hypothetical protein